MQKKTVSRIVFEIINYCIMFLLTAVCLLPVIHVLALSFSSNTAAAAGLVKLLPVEFTTYSYQYVAGFPVCKRLYPRHRAGVPADQRTGPRPQLERRLRPDAMGLL